MTVYHPRDEQCDQRGPGLTHVVDGTPFCIECGRVTATFSRPRSGPPLIPKVTKVADRPPERLCSGCSQPSDINPCPDCRTMRRLHFLRMFGETPLGPARDSRSRKGEAGAGSLDDWDAETIEKAVRAAKG